MAIFELVGAAVVLWLGRRRIEGGAGRAALGVLAGGALVWGRSWAGLALTGQLAAFWFALYGLTLTLPGRGRARPGATPSTVLVGGPILAATLPLWWGALRGARRGLPTGDAGAGQVLRVWLVFALLGAAASGQFWPHYALQFLPPLLLAGVVGLADLGAGLARVRPG